MAIRTLRRQLISRTARVWSRLNKRLNKELNEITQSWLKKLIKQAESDIASGDISNAPDFPEKFTKVLQKTLREALAYGYWLQQLYLYERRGKKYKGKITLSEGDDVKESLESFIFSGEWNDVIPEDAVNWINNYVPKLAGVLNQDVLEKTRDVIRSSLLEGTTLKERVKALREAAPELSTMAQHRLEAIARTEITRADTLGRLASMKANDDVIGVEFSAVMDDRTTEMCISRHGLVMRLDDPRLPENTPPIHVNCRSMLISLTVYDYPDGLLTSREFDEIPAGIQRPEDIEEVKKVLETKIDEVSLITTKLQELKDKNADYLREYYDFERQMQAAVDVKDTKTYDLLFEKQKDLMKLMRDTDKAILKVKVDAAEKGVIFASGLEKKLDKADINTIIELIKNAPSDIRKVWNLYEDRIKIGDCYYNKRAYYNPRDHSIYFNIFETRTSSMLLPYSTLFHESGHLIDHSVKNHMYFYSQDGSYDLYNTLKSEVNSYIDTRLKELKSQAVLDGKDPRMIKKSDVYNEIEKKLYRLPVSIRSGISDMFSGITFNKVKDGYYHPTKYWKDNPEFVCLEFFAETYSNSIVSPEAIETVKRYIPKSYAVFDKILKNIVNGALK